MTQNKQSEQRRIYDALGDGINAQQLGRLVSILSSRGGKVRLQKRKDGWKLTLDKESKIYPTLATAIQAGALAPL